MTVLELWFEEVWNKGSVAAIDELWVPEKVVHGLAVDEGKYVKTIAEFKAFHQLFHTAFSNINVKVEETVTEGDKTVARVLVRGTHSGPGFNKTPIGKIVEFPGICMARLKDGKVVETWNNFDFMSMYKQME
jgi:predicted ester cyclase